jgi:hypothetical protein
MNEKYDLFASRHPLYRVCLPEWRFVHLAYHGGMAFKREHLYRHPAETAVSFAERLRRVHYENYVAAVAEEKAAILFKRPPYRAGDHPLWEEFNADVDRLGGSRDEFARRCFVLAQVFGWLPVLVDMPPAGDEGRAAPYCVPVLPFDFLNWAADERGRFAWVLMRERRRDAADPFAWPAERERFRLFDTEGWQLFESAADPAEGVVKLAEGRHGLGRVPVAILYDKRHPTENVVGVSSLLSVAERCRNILNNNSLIRDIADRCLFPFLAAEDYQGSGEQRERRIGTALMFWYPQGGSAPCWIEPDTSSIATLKELNEIEVERIYEEANLEGGFAAEQPRSGVAHSYEWRRTNDDIAAKARGMEEFERQLDSLFGAWLGVADFRATVSYPRDFSVLAFSARLSEAQAVFSLPLPDSARRLYLRRFARELLDNMTPGEAEEVDGEIGEMEFDLTEKEIPPAADHAPRS